MANRLTWQLRSFADVAPTPWRNGGGVTRELVAWPDPHAWTWRVSVAEVASDGPFSRFDGVQRWLAILHGAGVRLAFPGRVVELTAASAPVHFDGADPVDCSLLAGPVRDLNLMVRGDPAALACRMRRIAGKFRLRLDGARTLALYVIAPPASVAVDGVSQGVPPDTLAWRMLPAAAEIDIEAGAALLLEIGS